MFFAKNKRKRKRGATAVNPTRGKDAQTSPNLEQECMIADDDLNPKSLANSDVAKSKLITGTDALNVALCDGYYSRYLRFFDDLIAHKKMNVMSQDKEGACVTQNSQTENGVLSLIHI